ncbi:hypothetical protein MYCTH_2110669 [Thermothelomyces thermophilus ATCC 42464]|uniref:Zn(2)-C6 fungal-type domain-containing protein n=1 Tax=Thermothelomyces thermophilus (strain ATCC 42464 / BCRC 31852 / DSM 1799) TaxID=573729 RepID=G2QDN3_THET4|nr:uncharacterized protein MYCTH_2110669 [Thermothelomyces thermophilus ATCC 42464]AEO58344.1 hypothetical protein MYCTH_2110669 [Thermothelomyces thermophilus ATCC 42464]
MAPTRNAASRTPAYPVDLAGPVGMRDVAQGRVTKREKKPPGRIGGGSGDADDDNGGGVERGRGGGAEGENTTDRPSRDAPGKKKKKEEKKRNGKKAGVPSCLACRGAKARCDRVTACERCIRAGEECRPGSGGGFDDNGGAVPVPVAGKAARACERCRRLKAACARRDSCVRCERKGIECVLG